MCTALRVVVSHLSSSGATLTHFGQEQFDVNAATIDQNGITAVLNSNGKKRGASIMVHSYAILDPQYLSNPGILS